jgi:hypothetical protein
MSNLGLMRVKPLRDQIAEISKYYYDMEKMFSREIKDKNLLAFVLEMTITAEQTKIQVLKLQQQIINLEKDLS